MFWDGTPDDKKNFVANPSQGSRHNRGCAVDLTLYNLDTGKPVVMTGGYDEMSERSYPNYPGGTALQRANRDLLRKVMESEGFSVFQYEWWHFDYKDWQAYPILNKTFEELDQRGNENGSLLAPEFRGLKSWENSAVPNRTTCFAKPYPGFHLG